MFSNKTRQGVATGNVVIVRTAATRCARRSCEFNIDDVVGVVFDGELDFDGRRLSHAGPARCARPARTPTSSSGGRFTTCRCPKDTDRDPVGGARAEGPSRSRRLRPRAQLDDRGARRSGDVDSVRGLSAQARAPDRLPVSAGRHSSQSGGNDQRSRSSGRRATTSACCSEAEYLVKRGFKPSADLEWVFGQRGTTEVYGTFIHDIDIDTERPTSTFGDNRWGATWRHEQDLPSRPGWRPTSRPCRTTSFRSTSATFAATAATAS